MVNRLLSRPVRLTLLVGITSILAACSGNVDSVDPLPSSGMSLTGSVGDGPIIGAEIHVVDALGEPVVSTSSSLSADYRIDIPDGTPLPVTAAATGGTDLITGRPAEFKLEAIAFESGPVTLNMTPYTTLAVKIARCRDEVSPQGIEDAWQRIDRSLNLGWRAELAADPMAMPIDDSNVATVLLANEALGEVLRRTENALLGAGFPVEQQEIVDRLACDLADGGIDASNESSDERVTATLLAALAGVQLEVVAGQLYVDDQSVAMLLDDAIRTIRPESTAEVLQVIPPAQLLAQATRTLAVLQGSWSDDNLLSLQLALADAGENTARGLVAPILTTAARDDISGLVLRVALADDTAIEDMRLRSVAVADASAPVLSFSADSAQVAAGTGVMLSWASDGAEQCRASGAWSGARPVEGAYQTEALTQRSVFTLSCVGLGGSVTNNVAVDIAADESTPPAPLPTVTLSTSATAIDAGDSVELSWASTGADSCSASNGWSGGRSGSGSMIVGPLSTDATFTLTCSGAGGSASDSVVVSVNPPPNPEPEPTPAPTVNLTATPTTVESGAGSTLDWNTTSADSCEASGGWSGAREISGSVGTGSLTTDTSFTLTCSGSGGSSSASVSVSVNDAPAPTLSFSAADSVVDSGNATTLNWSATDADSCTASGGWSGARAITGSQTSGALTGSTTFTLTCSGAGGSVVEMIQVDILGSVTLSWQAPTENVDGSPLTDLSGYRIYYGESSRDYPGMVEVTDPATTSQTLDLESGTYFIAMTALDADDNESGYSNEVTKTVQ